MVSDGNNCLYEPGTTKYKSRYVRCTHTTDLQSNTENECSPFFISVPSLPKNQREELMQLGFVKDEKSSNILLLRKKHGAYLRRALMAKDAQQLPGSYVSLDSSKPWIIYWTLHSLDLLDDLPDEQTLVGIVHTLESCWTNVGEKGTKEYMGGGFGGGPNQLPHCATTYAAVNALSIIAGCDLEDYPNATRLALDLLKKKRDPLLKWYITLRYERRNEMNYDDVDRSESKNPIACGYRMHHDGEVDVRATYCITSVLSLLNILTDEVMNGMIEHIIDCQTYEGGFGGEPFAEAHGGYTFCAMGALHILTKAKGMKRLEDSGVDFEALQDWLVRRQMGYEGGFQGRCNKLADGCYSFWVGGAIALAGLNDGSGGQFDSGVYSSEPDECRIERTQNDDADAKEGQSHNSREGLLFDEKLLERYVLLCAQDTNGGLRDKPSKPRDFYHSCYNLSGLSASQHVLSSNEKSCTEGLNILGATHPVYNIRNERVRFMIQTFH